MKLLINQSGPVSTFLKYNGLYHNDDEKYIFVYYSIVKEQPGLPTVAEPQQPMRVDNTTRLPIVDAAGNPVTETRTIHNGQYAMVTDNGIETYPDYNQPIMVNVQVPKKIGEYNAILWWHWDRRNPVRLQSIEQMIEAAMRRRVEMVNPPYVFVQTAAWLATL